MAALAVEPILQSLLSNFDDTRIESKWKVSDLQPEKIEMQKRKSKKMSSATRNALFSTKLNQLILTPVGAPNFGAKTNAFQCFQVETCFGRLHFG